MIFINLRKMSFLWIFSVHLPEGLWKLFCFFSNADRDWDVYLENHFFKILTFNGSPCWCFQSEKFQEKKNFFHPDSKKQTPLSWRWFQSKSRKRDVDQRKSREQTQEPAPEQTPPFVFTEHGDLWVSVLQTRLAGCYHGNKVSFSVKQLILYLAELSRGLHPFCFFCYSVKRFSCFTLFSWALSFRIKASRFG